MSEEFILKAYRSFQRCVDWMIEKTWWPYWVILLFCCTEININFRINFYSWIKFKRSFNPSKCDPWLSMQICKVIYACTIKLWIICANTSLNAVSTSLLESQSDGVQKTPTESRQRGMTITQTSVLNMTQNYLMERLISWSFEEWKIPLQYNYSQVHLE